MSSKIIEKVQIGNDEYVLKSKYWGNYDMDSLKTICGESIVEVGGGDINTNIEKVTYSELKNLKESDELIYGKQYRIIDYKASTSQSGTRCENNFFDIIVTANSNNTFSEVARACLNDVDTYFTNVGANLNAWKIWYCFDNNQDRFSWADTTNGRGVIYRMIDEWNNDCPYDFKNFQFERDINWINNHRSKYDCLKQYTSDNTFWFYTFSRISTNSSGNLVSLDDSLNNSLGGYNPCRNNTIGSYSEKDGNGKLKYYINNTIFIGRGSESNHFGENNFNNTFASIYNNYFDMGCKNNIVYKSFSTNKIGINFDSNIIDGSFNYNNIDSNFASNKLGSVLNCKVGDCFFNNNASGKTIKYCDFGGFIQNCTDLPSMTNVIFDNEVVKDNDTKLTNITISTGEKAYDALSNLSNNSSKVLFTKQNNVYYVVDITKNEIYVVKKNGNGGTMTVSIDPNVYYKITDVKNLTVNLNTGNSGKFNNYMFEITFNNDESTLSLPNNIRWSNGISPSDFKNGVTYQISIINNLGVFTEFNDI